MALDASERRTLAACAMVAGCVLLLPRQWPAAAMAFALAIALLFWDRARSKREGGGSGGGDRAGAAVQDERRPAEAGAEAVDAGEHPRVADDAALEPALAGQVDQHHADDDR